MEHYAGIDVSLEQSSVCVVDATGRIVREAKVASEPEALIALVCRARRRLWLGSGLRRVRCRSGSTRACARRGLPVELLETRHVRDAFKAMPVKTDRKDARGIAQLMRLGWFRPVHCKSLPAQETRALLTARKLLQAKLHDVEMSLRGHPARLRPEGQARPRPEPSRPHPRAGGRASDAGQHRRRACWRRARVLARELQGLETRVRRLARDDERARLLMSAPGVGAIVALTYVAAIDDPGRFRSSKAAGAHFGLTPKRYQSGETDVTGRISKIGDAGVRTALYEAAHVILTRPVKGSALKSWAMRVAKRAGMRKAKVALARKLAVVLHRMLADGTTFDFGKAAAAAD